MKKVLILLFLFSCSTINRLPIEFGICDKFTISQQNAILGVCEEWNEALHTKALDCSIGEDKHHMFYREETRSYRVLGETVFSYIAGKLYDVDIIVSPSLGMYSFETVIRHELGHVLGLDHMEDTVMQAGLPPRTILYITDDVARKTKHYRED